MLNLSLKEIALTGFVLAKMIQKTISLVPLLVIFFCLCFQNFLDVTAES